MDEWIDVTQIKVMLSEIHNSDMQITILCCKLSFYTAM